MNRGDIYYVNLNPTQGREQAGRRYVLIVSPRDFNWLGTPLVCPITLGGNVASDKGFAVSLSGTRLIPQGVVQCNQPRVLDLQSRQATFVEKVPAEVIDEVLGKLITLLE